MNEKDNYFKLYAEKVIERLQTNDPFNRRFLQYCHNDISIALINYYRSQRQEELQNRDYNTWMKGER